MPQAFYRDLRHATGFLQRSLACHYRKSGGQRLKFLLYSTIHENFSKIVAFKGTIRKFLNIVAVHIEGLRHPAICLFDTLFGVNVPHTM
jgi:hypothetical protein